MGWRFVRQPNGLYALFAEPVDDFTHYNLSEQGVLDAVVDQGFSRDVGVSKLRSAQADRTLGGGSERADGLNRFHEAIRIIRTVHGPETARMRAAQLSQRELPE